VLSTSEIEEVLAEARREQAFIFYTLVNPENRELIRQQAQEHGIEAADLIGSLMVKLANYLGQKPLMEPGLGHELDEDYFRRVEAVEFAVKNDDGQEPRNLLKADIVLVGLSRTSKTPLSIYLAHKGWKVANVPLVRPIPPPQELFQIAQEKIFALSIGLDALIKIRRARLRHLGLSETAEYATRDSVAAEIKWVQEFYAQHPHWPVFDVTNRAIEETAAEVLRIHEQNRRAQPAG
jgi:regulator of PEP synthase PpsR (kinase-PPPase family)